MTSSPNCGFSPGLNKAERGVSVVVNPILNDGIFAA
jgi:hypothetical protein